MIKKAAPLFAITAGTLWGITGLFVRRLTAFGFKNADLLFIRSLISCLVLLVFLCLRDRSLLRIKRKDFVLIMLCGVVGIWSVGYCYNIALSTLPLSLAAVLICLSPIYVLLYSYFLKRKS